MASDCILWTKGKDKDGYGISYINGKTVRIHRTVYEKHHGVSLSSNQFVCHKCDTPSCINVHHLFLGTAKDNSDDKVKKRRQKAISGENHYKHILSDSDVREIRQSPLLQRELSTIYNISQQSISRIKNRLAWKHVL